MAESTRLESGSTFGCPGFKSQSLLQLKNERDQPLLYPVNEVRDRDVGARGTGSAHVSIVEADAGDAKWKVG